MLIDSHCHLTMVDLDPFEGQLDKVIKHAESQGVKYFLNVSVTLDEHPQLLDLSNQYSNVWISIGHHPNETPGEAIDIDYLKKNAKHERVIAIGETGLDYYRSQGDLTWQHERFAQHIQCAKEIKKPLIIHTRDAKDDTIKIMQGENAKDIGGVMHCFTEDWDMAKKALDLNFYISFSGIVTFKSATQIQEVARKVPLDRMLVETDCPYLAPVPMRGKPNLPGYVCHTAEYIAKLRNQSFDEIAKATSQNFFTLFNPPGALDLK